ncbi:MAG: oligosaccharide flippase family protein [Nanohaloarchaea archaeon]|nr:oligosaccharide flippase family protein [Candidatus Nanohaloarchaea archaeon]
MATLYQKGFLESIYNLVGSIGSVGLLFLIQILIIKNLSVENYGIYNILISISTGAYFLCNFGIESIIERYLPEYIEKNNYKIIKKIIKKGILITISSLIFVSLILILFGNLFSSLINSSGIERYFVVLSIIFILNLEIKIQEAILNAYIDQKTKNLVKIFSNFVYLGLIYYFFTIGLGLWGALYSMLITNIILFILFFRKTYHLVFTKKTVGKEEKIFKKISRYGILLYLSGLGDIIFQLTTDVIIISYFLSSYWVGIYSFSYTFTRYMFYFLPPVIAFSIILPVIIREYNKNKNILPVFFKLYNKLIAFFSIPLCIGGIILSEKIITLIFGSKYLPGIEVFNIYMIFFLIWSFGYPLYILVRVLEKPKIIFYSRIFIIYNLAADIILVPSIGILGAAIATGTSIFFVILFQLIFIKKEIKIKYPWKNFALMLVNSVPMAILLYFIEPFISTRIELFGVVALGSIIYFIMGLINKQFKEDWNILNSASKLNVLKYF